MAGGAGEMAGSMAPLPAQGPRVWLCLRPRGDRGRGGGSDNAAGAAGRAASDTGGSGPDASIGQAGCPPRANQSRFGYLPAASSETGGTWGDAVFRDLSFGDVLRCRGGPYVPFHCQTDGDCGGWDLWV